MFRETKMNFPSISGNKIAALEGSDTPQKLYTTSRIREWIEDPWSGNRQPTKEEQWEQDEKPTPPTPCVSSCSGDSANKIDIQNLAKECEQTITELQTISKQRQRREQREQKSQLTELRKLLKNHYIEKTQHKTRSVHPLHTNR